MKAIYVTQLCTLYWNY